MLHQIKEKDIKTNIFRPIGHQIARLYEFN
jgi:hypothetical protein